jgi:aspartate kinase
VLLISQSSSQNDLCLVIGSSHAKAVVEALHHEFAHDLAHEKAEHITVDPTVAIVAVVGQNVRGRSGLVSRTFRALDSERIGIVAIAHGSTECTISFVVAKDDLKAALKCIHREFQLGSPSNKIVIEPENYFIPCAPSQNNQLTNQKQ